MRLRSVPVKFLQQRGAILLAIQPPWNWRSTASYMICTTSHPKKSRSWRVEHDWTPDKCFAISPPSLSGDLFCFPFPMNRRAFGQWLPLIIPAGCSDLADRKLIGGRERRSRGNISVFPTFHTQPPPPPHLVWEPKILAIWFYILWLLNATSLTQSPREDKRKLLPFAQLWVEPQWHSV